MRSAGILLAATGSSCGKTMITCGILQALKEMGKRPAACKCGPDYIDTMFHQKVLGIPSINLDSYFADRKTLRYLYGRHASRADITVVEGVMGYYDGIGGDTVQASAYEVADSLGLPAVLIVNCEGLGTSLSAIVQGFLHYRKESRLRGVILNRLPAARYGAMKELIEHECGIRVLGYVPKAPECVVESRHLGLVTPGEIADIGEKLSGLAEILKETLDWNALFELAELAEPLESSCLQEVKRPQYPVSIAVARDAAFCFFYADNLRLLAEMGAKLQYFSPMEDEKLPEGVSGLLLGGGYPELYAERLSANERMLSAVRAAVRGGMPTIAECGGFLYLHEAMSFADGRRIPMAGVIPGQAEEGGQLRQFGYVSLTAKKDNLLLSSGETIRAHEFHYWKSGNAGADFHAVKASGKGNWPCVHAGSSLYAGFPHLYFYHRPQMAEAFLQACRNYGGKI